jgi:hypothetical protein
MNGDFYTYVFFHFQILKLIKQFFINTAALLLLLNDSRERSNLFALNLNKPKSIADIFL